MDDLLTKDFMDLLENFRRADKHAWSNLHMDEQELRKLCEKQQKRALVIAERFRHLADRFDGHANTYTKTIFTHRETDEYIKTQYEAAQTEVEDDIELFNRIFEQINKDKSPK